MHTDSRSGSLGSRYYHAWCSRSWLSARLSVATLRKCRIHGHPLAGPGCLVESKHVETHSKRLFVARLDGQSAWARNRIHERNGRSKLSTVSLYQSLGITSHCTRVDYVLCGNGIESNKSKCCATLPGAWVPANAGTHAEPLFVPCTSYNYRVYMYTSLICI